MSFRVQHFGADASTHSARSRIAICLQQSLGFEARTFGRQTGESQPIGVFRVVHSREEVSATSFISIDELKEPLARAWNEITVETCASISCSSTTAIR